MTFKKDTIHHLAVAAGTEMGEARDKMWAAQAIARRLRIDLAKVEEEIATHQDTIDKAEVIWDVLSPLREGALRAEKPAPAYREWSPRPAKWTRLVEWAEKAMRAIKKPAEDPAP